MKVTNHEELLVIALRAHLYIEREITSLFKKIYKDEKYNHLSFAQKVDLCKSLDIIESERIGPLTKLNKHRNALAHDLDFRILESDFDDLLSTLSKESKKHFEIELEGFYKVNSERERSLKDNYRILLAAIWSELKTENLFFFDHFNLRAKQILESEAKNIQELFEKYD
ncbi:hypothetical protein ACWGJQ_25920 [Peribacillus simplex]